MSKTTNKKKTPDYAKKNKPNKKKKIVVIIVAAVLAVAIAAAAIIMLVSNNSKGKLKSDEYYDSLRNEYSKSENQPSEKYTYVNYKGCDMPEDFAEMLDKAAVDNQKSIDKYGCALKVGDRKISYSVLQLYYYDEFATQIRKSINTYEAYGRFTSFDPAVDPLVQRSMSESGSTYGEAFYNDAVLSMQKFYSMFDIAISENYQLTEEEIEEIYTGVMFTGVTDVNSEENDKVIEDYYFEGITFAMYCEREILSVYAKSYYENYRKNVEESVTYEQCKEEFEKNSVNYKRVYGRVFPLEDFYDENDIEKIKTEKDFMDYVNNNSTEDYDYEQYTLCPWYAYTDLKNLYGDDVADWMFDSSRKKGDIAFIGDVYPYLVYIEELPTLMKSKDVVLYSATYPDNASDEEKVKINEETEKLYKEWVSDGANPEKLKEFKTEYGSAEEMTVSGTYFPFTGHSWVMSLDRKSGDYYNYTDSYGAFIIYFIGNNENYEWVAVTRTDIGVETASNFLIEKVDEYKCVPNEDVVNKVHAANYERQIEIYEKYKKDNNIS